MADAEPRSAGGSAPHDEAHEESRGDADGQRTPNPPPPGSGEPHGHSYGEERSKESRPEHVVFEQWGRFRRTPATERRAVAHRTGQEDDPDTDDDGNGTGQHPNDAEPGDGLLLSIHGLRIGSGGVTPERQVTPTA